MLITNIKIYPLRGRIIPNGYLRAENGLITGLGSMEDLTDAGGDGRYDFDGALALPGLVDAHSHVGMFGDALGFEGDDGNETTDPCTPHLRALDGLNPLDRSFAEALDYGVTTVVTGPGSANAISGQSVAMKTYGCCVDDMIINPAAAMKLALGENPKGTYAPRFLTPSTRMATAAVIREELCRARRYQEDLDRCERDDDDEIDPPEYDIKSEALLPVLRGEMPVHIHAHRADDIFTAARIAREFSLRCVLIHATEAHLIADRFAAEGIAVICGPMLGTRNKPELLAYTRTMPGLLHRRGIRVAICTDHPELPQEMLMLSAAIACREGMPRAAALRAITLTAAEICGIDGRVGSLEVGKDADVVVYARDPLLGLEKPAAVFAGGIRVR